MLHTSHGHKISQPVSLSKTKSSHHFQVIMCICQKLFHSYGTQLRWWLTFSQSNGQVELAIKTTKRIINHNTGLQGFLDNVAWAILLYWNTPIQSIGLSPAQLLFHCQLCDSIPLQPIIYKPNPEWIAAAQRCREILHHCNAKIIKRYNRYIHHLCPLQTSDTEAIPNPLNHQWNTTGKIITVLPDCQYRIRADGSGRIMLRNCCFLRKWEVKTMPTPILSAMPEPTNPTSNIPLMHPDLPLSSRNDAHTAIRCPTEGTCTSTCLWSSKILWALYRLFPHYKLGLKNGTPLIEPCQHTGEGEGRCRGYPPPYSKSHSGIPMSIQMADKWTSHNSVQSLVFVICPTRWMSKAFFKVGPSDGP